MFLSFLWKWSNPDILYAAALRKYLGLLHISLDIWPHLKTRGIPLHQMVLLFSTLTIIELFKLWGLTRSNLGKLLDLAFSLYNTSTPHLRDKATLYKDERLHSLPTRLLNSHRSHTIIPLFSADSIVPNCTGYLEINNFSLVLWFINSLTSIEVTNPHVMKLYSTIMSISIVDIIKYLMRKVYYLLTY